MRHWLSLSFSFVEDVIYVGLGLLLTGVAGALLIEEIIYFVQYLLAGQLSENIVMNSPSATKASSLFRFIPASQQKENFRLNV